MIDAADYNDERYLAVVPYAEDSTEQLEEDANLIIMRVGEEDGEEYLDVVDDDEELYEVSDMFARRLRSCTTSTSTAANKPAGSLPCAI